MATQIINLKNCINEPSLFGTINWITDKCFEKFSEEVDKVSILDELIINMDGLINWEVNVEYVIISIIEIINKKRPGSCLKFANIPVFAYEYFLKRKASNVILTIQWT